MRRTIMAIAAATMLLVGCSATSDGSAETDPDDTMFAQMMIPHHEQAIEMSDIALDPTTGAGQTVRDLATRIKAEQDPEIAQMTSLLAQWGQPTQADPSVDHSSMMGGMLSADELSALGAKRGSDFDESWLRAMIAHHEGAVDMARDVIDNGSNAELRALAEAIVSSQLAEIDEMKEIVGN